MAIFRGRFSSRQLILLFTLTAFPAHVWTIYNLLLDIPSMILYMSTGEVISSIGYTLAFALLETLLVFLPLILVGMLLPKRWASEHYLSLASVWLLVATGLTLLLQVSIRYDWPKKAIFVSIPLALGLGSYLGLRFPKISQTVLAITERLTILTFFYIAFDLAGLVLVIARNI